MHPFPPADEFECLIGDEIEQVCIGPFQVQLHFGKGTRLELEEGLTHRRPDGTEQDYDCDAAETPTLSLHHLLMRPVINIERQDYRLTLDFADGTRLVVWSEAGPYESGQFATPDGRLLVF